MESLSIRNLPDDVHARLRVRAALHGRGMALEARDILAPACLSPPGRASDPVALRSLVDQLYDVGRPGSSIGSSPSTAGKSSANDRASVDPALIVETIR